MLRDTIGVAVESAVDDGLATMNKTHFCLIDSSTVC